MFYAASNRNVAHYDLVRHSRIAPHQDPSLFIFIYIIFDSEKVVLYCIVLYCSFLDSRLNLYIELHMLSCRS